MNPQPQQERVVDILKVDTKLEKYVEDFVTFSKREKMETVKEIHDIILSCSRPAPSAITLQEYNDTIRNETLDELEAKLVSTWEEAKNTDDPEWEETHSFTLKYLKDEINSLRREVQE